MSALNSSGDLLPYTQVLPAALATPQKPTATSLITARRQVKIVPQGGMNYGSAGAGGGAAQLQFLIPATTELIDPRSVRLSYTIQTSGTTLAAVDDGHPFTTVQISIGGRIVDNIQNAAKLSNIECKMGASGSWYRSAGSFAGFELLNPDLTTTVPTSTFAIAMAPQFGYVANNLADITTRCKRAANAIYQNIAGEQRTIPCGLMSGLFRVPQYLPLRQMGDVSIVLVSGSKQEVCVQPNASADADYSLSNVFLEYDVLECSPEYAGLLARSEIVVPFESTIVAQPGAVQASASSITQTDLTVSRATTNLIRTSLVQVPSTLTAAYQLPVQSCFSHAGLFGYQVRVGSRMFPSIPTTGDAALFAMSLAAYGSPIQEGGSVVNRVLWGNSTNATTAATPDVYETADAASGGTKKFCFGDSCIPSYGFRLLKGGSDPLDVDGVNVSADSGAQMTISIASAPAVAYAPYVSIVALKFLKVSNGAFECLGA